MEKIIINTGDALSAIMVGARWEAVIKLLPSSGVILLTDSNILRIYGSKFPDIPVLCIEPGEGSKQLGVIEKLAGSLLKAGIDRNGFILAVGGGVVCDIAGFLASVYMRGIRCGYVSASLLSQVDASTGGKTGVNLGKAKNMIGSFRQPEFVICDTTMLRTLPEDEYLSGLAELIKTGIIGDPEIFNKIEKNSAGIIKRDRDLLAGLVGQSVKFKAAVVSEDEREAGLRRILNFGHTFGHAFELYLSLKHGFAVAAGMEIATRFSVRKGYISAGEADRITGLLNKFGLLKEYRMPASRLEKLVSHDKKKTGNELHFIFTGGIGKAFSEKVAIKELRDFYRLFLSGK